MTDQNPIADLVQKAEQQKIEGMRNDITKLKAASTTPRFIDLEIFQDIGSTRVAKRVSINPECIVFIKDDGSHAYVGLSHDTAFHTIESREEILALIQGKPISSDPSTSKPTYIK